MENLMEIMDEMKNDKVVNVKLLLAETIKQHLDAKGPLSGEEAVLSLVGCLKEDENEQVRDVFEDL